MKKFSSILIAFFYVLFVGFWIISYDWAKGASGNDFGLLVIMVAVAGFGIGFMSRRQRTVYYRRQYQAEQDRLVERRAAELRILHANRLYNVLSQINQSIVRTGNRTKLLQDMCSIAVEFGGFQMAWVGLVVPDTGRVIPAASSGVGLSYLNKINISVLDEPAGRGPTGTAIRENRLIISNDISSDPRMLTWRGPAMNLGFRSSASIPLTTNNVIIGALSLYSAEPGFFDESEIKLLNEIGEDISFALSALEEEETRKRAERRLIESEKRYRLLAENVTDMISQHDLDGLVHYVSPSCLNLLGYPPEKVVGQDVFKFIHPEDVDNVRIAQSLMLQQPIMAMFSYRLLKKNGEYVWVESTAKTVLNTDTGKIDEVIVSTRDITERKKADDLRIGKEAAEAMSRAKSEFLASMSHELRTPLNAIIGFSEILQDRYFGPLNEKQLEYVTDIVESGHHLLSLINDILDITKIEAGKSELELSKVRIKSLLENSMFMIKEKTLKHNIRMVLDVPPEVGNLVISADERKLKQIMFNLLSNASKFTPDGGAITVSAGRKGENVQIAVSDTGIGIAPEIKEKIFEPFFQAHCGLSNKTPGTGLGLSLSKQFVEMHKGRIWAESEGDDCGSTFYFTLPISESVLNKRLASDMDANILNI